MTAAPLPAPPATPARPPGNLRSAWRAALYAFALSRLLVALVALLAVAHATQWAPPGVDPPALRLATPEALSLLHERALGHDASWYLGIARDGYEQRPFDASRQANWAFFPLHAWLWRGGIALGLAPLAAGMLLANVFFLLALVQCHRWVQTLRDEATATRTVLCIALFPTAYFFSLPWTESLFLFLMATSLLAMRQGRWATAGMVAGLASGTRAVGVLLAPLLWLQARQALGGRSPRPWLWAAVATLGLALFMAVLWRASGNALAFADIQEAWGRDGGSFTKHLRRWLADPLLVAEPWNVRWVNNAALLFALAAAVWLWRQRQRALAVFAFVYVLLPWGTGTLLSMGRYVVACLPLFYALACWLAAPARLLAWLLASAFGLAWMSALFALGLNYAGA